MPDRPTGTVTFLFTDIEGSTTRWEQQRTAMHLLSQRDQIACLKGTAKHLWPRECFIYVRPAGRAPHSAPFPNARTYSEAYTLTYLDAYTRWNQAVRAWQVAIRD